MANYTIDGAKIDVGTRKFPFEKGVQMVGTTYIRVAGAGTYGAQDFQVTLELAEIIKPYSEFLPTDSDRGASGRKYTGMNTVDVIKSHALTDATLSVEECRDFCERRFHMDFLKGAEGRQLVEKMLGGNSDYESYVQAYFYQVVPPEHKVIAVIESSDKKIMLLKEEGSNKLVLPMAVRSDRSEPLSRGLSNCFLSCAVSVRDLQLFSTREHSHFDVQGLRDSFRAVSALSYLSSDTLSARDADLVGVTLPKDEALWDKTISSRIGEESLLILRAFRAGEKSRSADGAVDAEFSPQI